MLFEGISYSVIFKIESGLGHSEDTLWFDYTLPKWIGILSTMI